MGDPLTAAIIMIGATLDIAGKGMAYNAQRRAYEASAKQAEIDAAFVEEQTEVAAGRYKEGMETFQSRQRAVIGASGSTFEGSPLQIYEETTAKMEEDILQIRKQGKHEAERLRAEAGTYGAMAKQTAVAGLFDMGSTFLTGAYKAFELTPGLGSTGYKPIARSYKYKGLRFPG